MIDDEKRGKFLAELRKKKKLTQVQLGELIHYTDKNISKWERGISYPTNPNVLNKLAEIFDVSIEELVYGEYKKPDNEELITKNFENEYRKNYNIYRTRIISLIIIAILLFIIGSFIFIYSNFIKNTISAYYITSKNDKIKDFNSTLFLTNEINILTVNNISIENDTDIIDTRLFYLDDNNNEVEIFYGNNRNFYIEEYIGEEEYNLSKLVTNNVYFEIFYKDHSNLITLDVKKRYINNQIFNKIKRKFTKDDIKPKIKTRSTDEISEEQIITKLKELGFKEKKDYLYKIINENLKIHYIFNSNKLIMISDNSEITYISFYINDSNTFYYKKAHNNVSNIEFSPSEFIDCKKHRCDSLNDYANYLYYLKNEIYK